MPRTCFYYWILNLPRFWCVRIWVSVSVGRSGRHMEILPRAPVCIDHSLRMNFADNSGKQNWRNWRIKNGEPDILFLPHHHPPTQCYYSCIIQSPYLESQPVRLWEEVKYMICHLISTKKLGQTFKNSDCLLSFLLEDLLTKTKPSANLRSNFFKAQLPILAAQS